MLLLGTNEFESPLCTAQSELPVAFSARRRQPMGAPPFNGPLTSSKVRVQLLQWQKEMRLSEVALTQRAGSRNIAVSSDGC